MDLLDDIREKLPALDSHPVQGGVEAAVRHIEVAERWLARGRREADDDCFNDVIYRTNQTFEGMLKEAYTVFTGEDASDLSIYRIEKHLTDNDVLSSRVSVLFANYRKEWRNQSTHDHNLFFNDQEALLAIVSISAFVTILIDQMIEYINVERERKQLETRTAKLRAALTKAKKSSFRDEVVALLHLFSGELIGSEDAPTNVRHAELVGRLVGFIQVVEPSIKIEREPLLSEKGTARADLVLSRGESKVIIEVKRGSPQRFDRYQEHGLAQVLKYLELSGIKHGVLYFAPSGTDVKMQTRESVFQSGRSVRTVDAILPMGRYD